jgi:hypothetical protein
MFSSPNPFNFGIKDFTTDGDASFSEQIFNIAMAQVESIVKPDGVTDDIVRESVTLVSTHPPSLSISAP